MRSIELKGAGRFLGAEYRIFIAAEAVLNDNAKFALAHRLNDLAAEAGSEKRRAPWTSQTIQPSCNPCIGMTKS